MAEKKTAVDVNKAIYEEISTRITAALEQGEIPWRKPWFIPRDSSSFEERKIRISVDSSKVAYSYSTGLAYSAINQWLLPRYGAYATFKQITDCGGKVKKGSKASSVYGTSYKWYEKKDADGKTIVDDEGKPKLYCKVIVKSFKVFHIESQTEGVPFKPCKGISETIRIPVKGDPIYCDWDADANADKVLQDYWTREGIKTHLDSIGDRAFYRPIDDSITLPRREQFREGAEYYSTAMHESTHSTGHSSRLDRFSNAGQFNFGSDAYSREELVAEIGAAALCSLLGLETESSFRNSTAYCQGWAAKIKSEPDLILKAAQKAEAAVNFILSGTRPERH